MAAQEKAQRTGLKCDRFVCQPDVGLGAIVVEHSLSGAKRCRSFKDILRNTIAGFLDVVMEVACALHNLRVDFRHLFPTFDLLAGAA